MTLPAKRWLQIERQFVPLLLTTLLPILLLPSTASGDRSGRWLFLILQALIILQSLRCLPAISSSPASKRWELGYRLMGGLALATSLAFALSGRTGVKAFQAMLIPEALFALMSSVRLILLLARVPRVNAQVMAGAAAGYILLGLTGGLLATATQALIPGSFVLGTGPSLQLDRLTYFSFVTLAGLGYGDVLPGNAFGERFAILLSVSGTLYVVLLVGLLLGRFIASEEVRFLEQEEETRKRHPQDQ